jgi:hypothetical protein
MSPLNIHPEEAVNVPKKKKNKTLKVMLGIAALVAVPVVGTTLAASIGINVNNNSNTPIQFGQGVVQATACDDEVTVTALSEFSNSAGAGTFYLGDVEVTGIDVACDGKLFTVNAYDDASSTPLATCTGAEYDTSSGGTACAGGSTIQFENDGSGGLKVKFGTESVAAENVYKVTVETS